MTHVSVVSKVQLTPCNEKKERERERERERDCVFTELYRLMMLN